MPVFMDHSEAETDKSMARAFARERAALADERAAVAEERASLAKARAALAKEQAAFAAERAAVAEERASIAKPTAAFAADRTGYQSHGKQDKAGYERRIEPNSPTRMLVSPKSGSRRKCSSAKKIKKKKTAFAKDRAYYGGERDRASFAEGGEMEGTSSGDKKAISAEERKPNRPRFADNRARFLEDRKSNKAASAEDKVGYERQMELQKTVPGIVNAGIASKQQQYRNDRQTSFLGDFNKDDNCKSRGYEPHAAKRTKTAPDEVETYTSGGTMVGLAEDPNGDDSMGMGNFGGIGCRLCSDRGRDDACGTPTVNGYNITELEYEHRL
ncbi:hypothetical protein FN846DRAFT_890793 [Sphaerosporella brunnea]|uniref:Uncharacterized protein n=1 Tax=Sphaerosporella brunnea TaxID=1250544 RepID=A0A5J5EUL7_9PEZI|nr:hypothetical protein FN846DRAFT_890793 [Sphaerosporella brunnea]